MSVWEQIHTDIDGTQSTPLCLGWSLAMMMICLHLSSQIASISTQSTLSIFFRQLSSSLSPCLSQRFTEKSNNSNKVAIWALVKKKKKKKKKKIAILAQLKMVAEYIRFIIPRNSYTDVIKDTWHRG